MIDINSYRIFISKLRKVVEVSDDGANSLWLKMKSLGYKEFDGLCEKMLEQKSLEIPIHKEPAFKNKHPTAGPPRFCCDYGMVFAKNKEHQIYVFRCSCQFGSKWSYPLWDEANKNIYIRDT